ncbi:MAG: GNAT family N-acetyltransferase, partial [Ferruginibacter sp.]|nr:GNAT family N-acetyltransferase [Ferruginibacter sp.]
MKLVNELAVYEKAPDEVTVTMEHFVESGFGEKPVWEACVASPIPSEGGGNLEDNLENKREENLKNKSLLPSTNSPSPPGRIGGASSLVGGSIGGDSSLVGGRIGGASIIGFALYYTRYSTWKGQRMYLEDLLVTESMRGHGVGKLLFEKLMEECKAKKYSGLVWQVLDWNEPAINFYKKFEGVKFDGEWVNCSMEF